VFLQLLQRNADYFPDDIAIVYGDMSLTHAELLERVESAARGLLALGVREGDKVALLLENSPDFITSFFAVAACRAVNVPLNFQFKEEELRFYLSDANVKCLIVDELRADIGSKSVTAVSQPVTVIVSGAKSGDRMSFAELLESKGTAPLPNCALDDDIIYIYTSGSTGRPKCAPRTVVQYWWEMDDVMQGTGMTRDDVIFDAIPLFHNFGAVHTMLAAAGSGAKLVMLKNPNPFVLRRKHVLKQLESQKVTVFPAVPYMFELLAESSASADLSGIRLCYSASAVLARETAEAFNRKFGLQIREHYGCTEVGAMTIVLDDDPEAYPDSVGVPFPGVKVRILDDDGASVPVGSVGEIVVSSRQMTRGYLGMDAQANAMFRDGCFYTGDLGRLDDDGRLYLMGRKKLIIDVAGQKVSPIEVEDVLAEHPHVRESIVIGEPNPKGDGQLVHAYVAYDGTCDKNALIAFCRERLSNFKVPQAIHLITEVPRNTLGKVLRRKDELESKLINDFEELQDREAI
jgi:long-chain acyl-CoA synthetase